MKIKNLKGKKIAILGFGVEWKSTSRFLKKLEINDFEILDKKNNPNYLENLDKFDIIFKSPWISTYNLKSLEKVKDKLISQTNIFFDNYEWKVIWITWTKGKSTISTLTYEMLKNLWYKVKLVWNIGNSVLDEIDLLNSEKYDFIIYELSSYMLEWFSPKLFIGLLNNIYDCHLDWHYWRKNYEVAKFNIFELSKIKIASIKLKQTIEKKWFNNIIYFSDEIIFDKKDILLLWNHNIKNISGVLKSFSGLPHRQENIWKYNWITFIDDAIAVTQESTIAWIETFWKNIWTILIWWKDVWLSYDLLEQKLIEYDIPNIVLFPDSWLKIFNCFAKNLDFDNEYILDWYNKYKPKILKTKSMEQAVKFGYKNTKIWKICILSSGAQSFSLWKSYIEKAEEFKKAIIKYKN